MAELICSECGNAFYVNDRRGRRYCSEKCKHEHELRVWRWKSKLKTEKAKQRKQQKNKNLVETSIDARKDGKTYGKYVMQETLAMTESIESKVKRGYYGY